MFTQTSKIFSRGGAVLVTAFCVVLGSPPPAQSDDTEIFFSQPANTVQPNILLVVDTSGSMNLRAESTLLPYDPTQTYSDSNTSCRTDRIYYSTNPVAPTSCSGMSYIRLSGDFSASAPQEMKCKRAVDALAWGTGATGTGFYSDRFIRWRGQGTGKAWQSSLANASGSTTSGGITSGSGSNTTYATDVECLEDSGVHGGDTGSAKWPDKESNNSTSGRWTSTASSSWWGVATNTGVSVTLYSPNYINYLRNGPRDNLSRMDVVKAATVAFLSSLPNVNVGLMRYDSGAQGGMMMSPVSPLDAKREKLIDELTNTNHFEPSGNTPLSETLFEAYRYFSGGAVKYGENARMCTEITNYGQNSNGSCASNKTINFPSVSTSYSGKNYISPASEPCQANYIVYLTDGEATSDSDANGDITGLPDFATLGGAGCASSGEGRCLGGLAEYMYRADLRSSVLGNQNVKTNFIGFGPDFNGSATAFQNLQNAASRGGGQAYQADDLSSLAAVFNSIVTNILQASTTFTTPTVAVNAFNRTQTLSDLFVSVFQPNSSVHWPGNLKKYKVVDGVIMDSSSPARAAVDPNTGFFADSARSYWSTNADGSEVKSGGAARRLPDPASRNLYTFIGANPGTPTTLGATSATRVEAGNTALDPLLGLGAPGDPSKDDLVNWARGVDVRNEDGDASTTVRRAMGDPIHSPPAVVIYGGTVATPNLDDAAVFVTTNDGYLHAFDVTDGSELWAFIPQNFLGGLKNLYFDNPVPSKQYAFDGEIRVLRYDINGDGIITASAGDRVIIYVGEGRGGNRYHAFDVTSKTAPKFMWTIGATELPGIGQTWSTPVITRMNIGSATQNSQKLVLVMSGGYDPAEDGTLYLANSSVGNRIYFVDALRGTLLWSAGQTSSGATFQSGRMTHSIPSSVSVLDTNSDGYADRMYVGDMGGQLWRFDITNGNAASSLVAGGVIASLGVHGDTTPVLSNARKFYNPPDVAALQRPGGASFMNIAIGSGYRGHPLNTGIQDRFYSIRDYKPFTRMTQAQYDDLMANNLVTDASLTDITDDVAGTLPITAGWKLLLNTPDWRGEKSLGASNTFNNAIFFTTYTPPTGTSASSCGASTTGTNRAYVVNVFSGAPLPRRDAQTDPDQPDNQQGGVGDGELTREDRFEDLRQGGIAPEIAFLFPSNNAVVCLSGVEVLGACRNFNSRVKTYWRESGAN